MPDREKGWQMVRSLWPLTTDDPDLILLVDRQVQMPKFNPSRFDVGDYLTALSWVRGTEKREFRFVWWRSCELSFNWMSRRLGNISHDTVRRRYKDVILNAWYAANWSSTKSA